MNKQTDTLDLIFAKSSWYSDNEYPEINGDYAEFPLKIEEVIYIRSTCVLYNYGLVSVIWTRDGAPLFDFVHKCRVIQCDQENYTIAKKIVDKYFLHHDIKPFC
jgi:hypothetical protein